MKRFTGFTGTLVLALTFALFVFGCASSGASSGGAVQGGKNPEFSSFEAADKKIDLYALLESSEASHETWRLLSINVAKTSSDGKYIAVGSTEKILLPAIDADGSDASIWIGTGMVTIVDVQDGTVLYRLNDEEQYDQLKAAQENFKSQYMKVDAMINNNESKSEIERELLRLRMEGDRSVYLSDADLGIGFLEFTPDNEYIISAPRQLKKGSGVLDWVIAWSLKTGEMKWSYRAGFGGIKSLELIEDGSKIKVIDKWDRVTVINTATGRNVK
ncbi:MAG: hypothetical protein LBP23_02920 [Treponema sp.]|jgi:hypothetical protein|nr:hypothetical protein [Treponema sp.]